MSPAVRRYLSRETDRQTYERELGAAAVPPVTNSGAVSVPPEAPPG
jgi:hypothetical protein